MDLVYKAYEYANSMGKSMSVKYVIGILRAWKRDNNISTVEDLKYFLENKDKNKIKRYSKNTKKYIEKEDIQTGDLVFFKTGRGPNGYHVGIYVKEDKFLHASTKGGVVYSSLNSDYWRKTYWQARRI